MTKSISILAPLIFCAAARRLATIAAAFFLLFAAVPARASNVIFAFTNSSTGVLDTNDFKIIPLGHIRNADGSFNIPGLPIRVHNPTGLATNYLVPQYYQVTNQFIGDGMLLRIWDASSNTVAAGDPSIYCGTANPFVELTGPIVTTNTTVLFFTNVTVITNYGFTTNFSNVTSNYFYTNNVTTQQTNVVTITNDISSGTNFSLVLTAAGISSYSANVLNLFTNYEGAGAAVTQGAANTNDATARAAAERAAMISTNAQTTNFILSQASANTSFTLQVGGANSNLSFQIGVNGSNYSSQIGAGNSNLTFQIGANATNNTLAQGAANTNDAAARALAQGTANTNDAAARVLAQGNASTNFTMIASNAVYHSGTNATGLYDNGSSGSDIRLASGGNANFGSAGSAGNAWISWPGIYNAGPGNATVGTINAGNIVLFPLATFTGNLIGGTNLPVTGLQNSGTLPTNIVVLLAQNVLTATNLSGGATNQAVTIASIQANQSTQTLWTAATGTFYPTSNPSGFQTAAQTLATAQGVGGASTNFTLTQIAASNLQAHADIGATDAVARAFTLTQIAATNGQTLTALAAGTNAAIGALIATNTQTLSAIAAERAALIATNSQTYADIGATDAVARAFTLSSITSTAAQIRVEIAASLNTNTTAAGISNALGYLPPTPGQLAGIGTLMSTFTLTQIAATNDQTLTALAAGTNAAIGALIATNTQTLSAIAAERAALIATNSQTYADIGASNTAATSAAIIRESATSNGIVNSGTLNSMTVQGSLNFGSAQIITASTNFIGCSYGGTNYTYQLIAAGVWTNLDYPGFGIIVSGSTSYFQSNGFSLASGQITNDWTLVPPGAAYPVTWYGGTNNSTGFIGAGSVHNASITAQIVVGSKAAVAAALTLPQTNLSLVNPVISGGTGSFGGSAASSTTASLATNAQQWVDPSGNALTTTLLTNGVVLVGTNVWVTGSPTNTDNGAWYPWSTNLSLNTIFWTNSATATNGRHFFSDLNTITHGICPGTNDNNPMTIGCPNSIFTGLPNTCQWEYDPVDDNGAPKVGGNATLGQPTASSVTSGVQFNVPLTASTLNATNFSFGVLDETNLDNTAWMYAKAARLSDNQNVGRYAWGNVINKLSTGQTIGILRLGTGLLQYLTDPFQAYLTNQLTFAGDWTGGSGPWMGCGLTWTGAGFFSSGKDGFWFTGYYGTTNTGAALYGNCAVSFPWNVFAITSMLGTNGSTFVLQTNNNSGGAYTTASPTYTTKNGLTTSNGVVWFWTNSFGPQQLGWQLLSTGAGTNRFFGIGYANTTLSNAFIAGANNNIGSHLSDELAINTNITAPIWQAWNYDVILHESIESLSIITNNISALVNEWKTWSTNSWVVLLADYPTVSTDQQQQMLAYRSAALAGGCSMFDGFSPFVSTNMMVARGMDVNDSPHIALAYPYYGYWLYRWLDFQNFLYKSQAATGVTTNASLVGYGTLYITNGVIMSVH